MLEKGSRGGRAAAEVATPWGAVIAALLLFIPLHELLHAAWHPELGKSTQTVLIVWPAKLRFGVYYDGCMSRRRWLLMRLAPLAFLSVGPVGLLTLFQYVPVPFGLEVFLQVLMLVNGIGSGGDLVAVVWVLFQVPSGAQICFRGGKAYWRAWSLSGRAQETGAAAQLHEENQMVHRLSANDIQNLGFEWPKYALIEAYCVTEGGKVDLTATMAKMESSRAHYKRQLNAAFAFKTQTGADYTDFTDRFDDYARAHRELSQAISYLEGIMEAAKK